MGKKKKRSHEKPSGKKQAGIATSIKNVCATVKSNPLGATVITLIVFILAGIANATFIGFFNTCAVAIKSTSRSAFQKICDVYYIGAAKVEPSDIGIFPWLFSIELFILLIWYSQLKANELVDKAEANLEEVQKIEKEIADNQSAEADLKTPANVASLTHRTDNIKRIIQKKMPTLRRIKRVCWFISILSTLMIFYAFSSTLVSYRMAKRYRHSVVEVRPFISDAEYHHLNRQWVLMKSREDYRAIRKQIADYKKRSDSDDKSGE